MCQDLHHREAVSVEGVPAAIGPYSQAVIAGGFIFTSGQLPINPETGELEKQDITQQTRRIMGNIEKLLKESGSCLNHIVKTTVYIKDLNMFSDFNKAYEEYFKENPPARSCVEVSRLPKDALLEIEVVAVMDD